MAIPREIALTEDQLDEMMSSSWIMRVATVGSSGKINLAPSWFAWCSGKIYAFGRGQRVSNIRRNPTCTILVDRNEMFPELQGAMFMGQATILEDEAAEDADPDLEQARTILGVKYNGGHGEPSVKNPQPDRTSAVGKGKRWIVFTPDSVISWDNSKLQSIAQINAIQKSWSRDTKK